MSRELLSEFYVRQSQSNHTPRLPVGKAHHARVDIRIWDIVGDNADVKFYVESGDTHGNYFPLYTPNKITEKSQQSISIGPGMQIPQSLGDSIRIRWDISYVTVVTFSLNVEVW